MAENVKRGVVSQVPLILDYFTFFPLWRKLHNLKIMMGHANQRKPHTHISGSPIIHLT